MADVALGTISTATKEGLGWSSRPRVIWSECPSCKRQKWVPLKWNGSLCGKCSVRLKAQPRGAAAKKPGNSHRRGPLSPTWRGGRKKHAGGYVYVTPDPSDTIGLAMTRSIGYVLEHRLVMAHAIGRALHEYEEVHHRNGHRADNRLSNLELWIKSQPAGQRASEYHCPGCRCDVSGDSK